MPHSLTGQPESSGSALTGNLLPTVDNLFTIGSAVKRWFSAVIRNIVCSAISIGGTIGSAFRLSVSDDRSTPTAALQLWISSNDNVAFQTYNTSGTLTGTPVLIRRTGTVDLVANAVTVATSITMPRPIWSSASIDILGATFTSTTSTLSSSSMIALGNFTISPSNANYAFIGGGTNSFTFPFRGLYLIEILFTFTAVASSINDYFDMELYNNDTLASSAPTYIQWSSPTTSRPSDRIKWTGTYHQSTAIAFAIGMSIRAKRGTNNITNFGVAELKITLLNSY